MGCNYYFRPHMLDEIKIINKELEETLCSLSTQYKDNINKIIDKACIKYPFYKDSLDISEIDDFRLIAHYTYDIPDIHICKISVGWVPCFQMNKYFKSFDEFLSFYNEYKDEFDLVDEYNRIIDIEDFKNNLASAKERALPKNNRTNSGLILTYIKDKYGYDWVNSDFS